MSDMQGAIEQLKGVVLKYYERVAQIATPQSAESDGRCSGSAGSRLVAVCVSKQKESLLRGSLLPQVSYK